MIRKPRPKLNTIIGGPHNWRKGHDISPFLALATGIVERAYRDAAGDIQNISKYKTDHYKSSEIIDAIEWFSEWKQEGIGAAFLCHIVLDVPMGPAGREMMFKAIAANIERRTSSVDIQ